MATDFIKVDTSVSTAVHAVDLLGAINSLRDTINRWEKVYGLMQHMQDGSTFVLLAEQFGVTVAQAPTILSLVTVSRAKIRDNASTLTIIDQVG